MANLFTYLQATQNFIRDTSQRLVDPGTLVNYINRARREVAMRSDCIRILPPISGPVVSTAIVSGGTGYTAPVLTFSMPDSPGGRAVNPAGAQATGVATQSGGVVNNAYVTYGGDGYFAPAATISDPTGKGAIVTAKTSAVLTANYAQEVYNFADVDLSIFPGVASIHAVRSVSILYANSRYTVLVYSFSQYQALVRQYGPGMFQYTPVMGAQVGRGTAGSFYLYPVPSQTYQMEWDCSCLPSDLTSDLDYEPIPDPYTDAVPYFAAHLAYLELQNYNAARLYSEMFDEQVTRFGSYTLRGRGINPYGRS
jgi:hypothetical protein